MFSIFNKHYFLRDFFESFVDIHNHLLPGIDDGAQTIEESLDLLKAMKDLGITAFINTPHTMSDYYPNTPESIHEASRSLHNAIKDMSVLKDTKLSASSEYMMDGHFLDLLKADNILPLKDHYVLVEMSYLQAPINLEEILYEITTAGYIPVLAHPERYAFYHKHLNMYDTLKSLGCKFQLNILSLTPHYGNGIQKIANTLLKNGHIDFIGSDTHYLRHIQKMENLKISTKQKLALEPVFEQTKSVFSQ